MEQRCGLLTGANSLSWPARNPSPSVLIVRMGVTAVFCAEAEREGKAPSRDQDDVLQRRSAKRDLPLEGSRLRDEGGGGKSAEECQCRWD